MTDVQARPRAVADFADLKSRGVPIVAVTAYDFPSARAAESAGADLVLVGDSAAVTTLGYASTREVSLTEMLMLARAVRRGLTMPLLLAELPFGPYESSNEQAVASARQFADAGSAAVKLEGGCAIVDRVRSIVEAGIPVVGHLGLLPQQMRAGESHRVQAHTAEAAGQL